MINEGIIISFINGHEKKLILNWIYIRVNISKLNIQKTLVNSNENFYIYKWYFVIIIFQFIGVSLSS